MKPALFAFSALMISAQALAALPPYFQRQKELVAVLQSDQVAQAAAGASISSVRFVASDEYEVLAGSCTILAEIVNVPSSPRMPGPRLFTVKVARTAGCRR